MSSKMLASLAYRYLAWTAPKRCPLPPGLAAGQPPEQTPPITFPIMVYSHRGGDLEVDVESSGRRFVENTMPAFRHSVRVKVDLLELDVQLTRDGSVVVFHDGNLERMCGSAYRDVRVADVNYADLPRLNGHDALDDPDATRIPLLEEVLVAFPHTPLQIDVKVHSSDLVQKVAELVARHRNTAPSPSPAHQQQGQGHHQQMQHAQRQGQPQDGQQAQGQGQQGPPQQSVPPVLWGSFIHGTNSALYAANPGVPLFTSAPRALLLLMAHMAGRLADVHIYESAVIMPWRIRSWPTAAALLGWHRPDLLLPDYFRQLRARGVRVVLFSDVNDEAAFEACLAAGADALCTDAPSRLRAWLEQRELGRTEAAVETKAEAAGVAGEAAGLRSGEVGAVDAKIAAGPSGGGAAVGGRAR